MRNRRFPALPKLGPAAWVLLNKLRVTFGLPISVAGHVDYASPHMDEERPFRMYYLDSKVKRTVKPKEEHYEAEYFNV
jgi:hypothetical protein